MIKVLLALVCPWVTFDPDGALLDTIRDASGMHLWNYFISLKRAFGHGKLNFEHFYFFHVFNVSFF